jgi:hypothetical protein
MKTLPRGRTFQIEGSLCLQPQHPWRNTCSEHSRSERMGPAGADGSVTYLLEPEALYRPQCGHSSTPSPSLNELRTTDRSDRRYARSAQGKGWQAKTRALSREAQSSSRSCPTDEASQASDHSALRFQINESRRPFTRCKSILNETR